MSSEPNLSIVFFRQLQTLRKKVDLLEKEITNLEAAVSQVMTSQEDRIDEQGSWVNPYSDCGEAICNWRLDSNL